MIQFTHFTNDDIIATAKEQVSNGDIKGARFTLTIDLDTNIFKSLSSTHPELHKAIFSNDTKG